MKKAKKHYNSLDAKWDEEQKPQEKWQWPHEKELEELRALSGLSQGPPKPVPPGITMQCGWCGEFREQKFDNSGKIIECLCKPKRFLWCFILFLMHASFAWILIKIVFDL